MLVRLEGKGRLNQRLFRGLRRAIVERRLAPASRLPSTRALATDLGVSRNVVLLAFSQLVAEGYADGRGGSGTFVAATLPDPYLEARAGGTAAVTAGQNPRLSAYARRVVALAPLPAVGRPARPGLVYDFRYGVPAVAEFPQQAWARLTQRRLRTMSVKTLRYGRALGWLPLREAIAEYVTRTRGVAATFEQVVIVNGSQQALDLVARLLIDPGDRVVVEEPSYLSARQVFLAAGAELVSVPVDEAGLDVLQLPRRGPVRLAYVTPSHQFPLGGVLPLARRLELLQWAERAGAFVIEDDYDSEFWYTGHPIEAIQGLDAAGRSHLRRHILEGALSVAATRLLDRAAGARAATCRPQIPRRSACADLRTGGAGVVHCWRALRTARAACTSAQCGAARGHARGPGRGARQTGRSLWRQCRSPHGGVAA